MDKQESNSYMSGKKQRELIRAFDRELFTYTGQVAWFLPALFSFFVLILIMIPVQELTWEDRAVFVPLLLFAGWLSELVLRPYVNMTDAFSHSSQRNSTYEKLRYLPISRRQYRIVRMGYLVRFLGKLTVIGLVLQCAIAAGFHLFSVANVGYVLIVLFALPLFVGWCRLLGER